MIKKSLLILFLISCYALSFLWVSINPPVEMFSTRSMNAEILPSATLLKIISGNFSSIVSEFFFAYGSILLGNFNKTASVEDWEYVYKVLKISRDMDPYFKDPYRLVQGIYPWVAGMPVRTIAFLIKGLNLRQWDSFLPYYIGFDYYFFLNNYQESARYLFISAKISHNPFMANLASKIAYKGGDVDTGITFLTNMYTKTQNEHERKIIKRRLDALKGVKLLQKAINKYRKLYNKMPDNLNELITKGVIRKLPKNSYKVPYRIEKGRILFN